MAQLAPPDVMRGALRVLYVAAYTTRNWTLNEDVSRQQINDLWEAIHEIPSLVTRCHDAEEVNHEIEKLLEYYTKKWKSPDLVAIYRQAKENADGAY